MRSVLGLCFVLAGCANPLAQMDRLSEIEVEVSAPSLDVVATPASATTAPDEKPAGGFFSRLLSAKPDGTSTDRTASRSAKPARGALAMPDVSPGASVPYGEIARACDVSKSALGQQVERSAGYKVFDTNPQSTAPRTFYVTGFTDGCARQFTAALVLVGTPSRHEELRYGQPSDMYPYSQIDRAYEKIKTRVCGVPRGRPCGSRIRKMERDTLFLSTYERFSGNARWADILIHDGNIIAKDIKS